MSFRASLRVLAVLTAALPAGAAVAAPAKNPAPAPVVSIPIPVARATVYDQVFDPVVSAMRAALRNAAADKSVDRRDIAGSADYYAAGGYAPLWVVDGKLSGRAEALMKRLTDAAADGLNPADFPAPPVDFGRSGTPSQADIAAADVKLTLALVAYARKAYAGQLVPGSVSPNIGYQQHLPDSSGVLRSLMLADDPAATLAAYNPPQEEFAQLRDLLAKLRKKAETEKTVFIPAGQNLKPGMTDARVPLLRERFDLPAYVQTVTWIIRPSQELVYDKALVAAVEAFQKSENMKPDGVIGKGTVAAMNDEGGDDRIATVLANMERWRWMPRYLGRYYVRVNVPDFTLDVRKDGSIIHSTRVVVGKVELQTPIFSDEIQHIIVNPSWSVPASIIQREYLPALKGGGYPKGFDVFAKVGGRFRAVDPRTVDWSNVSANDVQFRQPPGERNALGVVKFMFPNKYAVYLHDTPSKSLFASAYRAYSHGCIRVQDPWAFADALLTEEGFDSTRLKKLVGTGETRVDLREHVYVHITYFTAWVNAAGEPEFRKDVYGHDKRIEQALGLLAPKS